MATIFVVGPKFSGLQHLKGNFEDYCANNSISCTIAYIDDGQGLAEVNNAISNNTSEHLMLWGPGLNANVSDIYSNHNSHSWIMLKTTNAPAESMTSTLNSFYDTLSDVTWKAWSQNPFTTDNVLEVKLRPEGTQAPKTCATFNL